MSTPFELIALVMMGGILELDRTSVFHGLLGEPIVVAPLAGFVVGDPMVGLKIGVVLQLFFLGSASMGGSSPPDGTLTALVATGASGLAQQVLGAPIQSVWVVAVLLFTAPLSRFGSSVEGIIKERNITEARRLDAAEGNMSAVSSVMMETITRSFGMWCMATAVSLFAGVVVILAVNSIAPANLMMTLNKLGRIMPFIAAGIALSSIRSPGKRAWFAVGCAGMALIEYFSDASATR